MWWGLGWTRQKCRLRQVEAEVIIGTNTSCCYEEKSEVYTQRKNRKKRSRGKLRILQKNRNSQIELYCVPNRVKKNLTKKAVEQINCVSCLF